jgi:UDPglucose--hexose-1-phosphate uridylyltransferase
MPQLRQNIITGEWVVFAPERAKRPSDYISIASERKQSKKDCPFCVDSGRSEFPNRLDNCDSKSNYIIKNKFPAFLEEPDLSSKRYLIEDEFFAMKPAIGGHDVVVIKDHEQSLPRFTEGIWEDLFESFMCRYKHYAKIPNVEYVMPIYNHGPQAAASIEHPHAQIFASAVVPNIVARELTHTAQYHSEHKTCAFCDLIAHEKSQNTRVLFENDDFIAFTFYAARFPFEIWIMPKKHSSDFYAMNEEQTKLLAEITKKVFSRLDETLNDPSVNFFLHSAPVNDDNKLEYYHWHLEVAPRLALYGGYELGSGMIIDIIAPEQAAEYLRLGARS